MSLTTFLNRVKLSKRDAEVIFDRDEPVGEATDIILPSRRWFRRDTRRPVAKRKAVAHAAVRPAHRAPAA